MSFPKYHQVEQTPQISKSQTSYPELVEDLWSCTQKMMTSPRSGAKPHRGFHLKTHGSFEGIWTTSKHIPPELRHGIFDVLEPLAAKVRFSNAPGSVQRDCVPTARGLSLKLLPFDQNFTFVDAPCFPFNSLELFVQFVKCLAKGSANVIPFLVNHPQVAWLFVSQLKPIADHLWRLKYFTVGSVTLGDKAAKLIARPSIVNADGSSEKLNKSVLDSCNPSYFLKPNFLGDELRGYVEDHSVQFSFDLEVLHNTSENQVFVEDLSKTWPPEQTFVLKDCASLLIQPQRHQQELDQLSYSPWEGRPLHVPLGAIMNARKEIYQRAKLLRSQQG